jgi:hypothetical protein
MLIVLNGRKTATLLKIAYQQADQRNIFFVRAHDATSLHQAYLHIAKCIGPEYLLKGFRGQDLQGIWSNESAEDKVGRFKIWLNVRKVLILFCTPDRNRMLRLDLYFCQETMELTAGRTRKMQMLCSCLMIWMASRELADREAAFPDEAKTILYTTRNPVFHKDNARSWHKVRLSTMNTEVCIFS